MASEGFKFYVNPLWGWRKYICNETTTTTKKKKTVGGGVKKGNGTEDEERGYQEHTRQTRDYTESSDWVGQSSAVQSPKE